MAAVRVQDSSRDIWDSTASSVVPINIRELIWEDKYRTLREFISCYRLPLAVKLKSGDINKFLTVTTATSNKGTNSAPNSTYVSTYSSSSASLIHCNTKSDFTSSGVVSETKDADSRKTGPSDVVLQIHEVRKRKIILARKMTWDKRQNDYVVTGEQVEIPASVKGWLEVVPEDGRPVEYFDTISGITNIKPKRFLVRTPTVGYQLSTEENGNSCWMPLEIKPSEVLNTGIIYIDNKKNSNSAQRSIFKRILQQKKVKKEKEQDLKYLQCFDTSGTEIMIPLIMSGVFSPVGDSSFANYDAVYEFQDLIMAFGIPVNAQLIHVSAKERFQCPKGVIRLYGTREEDLAIASKVGADGNLFRDFSNVEQFEIPLGADLLFSRGVLKKPTVNSNPENIIYSAKEPKLVDRETVVKEYIMSVSMNTFSETPYQRVCLPLNEKNKSVNTSRQSTNSSSINEDTDVNSNKVIQRSTVNGVSTFSRPSSVEPDSQSLPKHLDSHPSKSSEQTPSHDVELPEKLPKEMKSRPGSILEKFSVRKVQRERARMKELRSDDVFSRRLSRSELSYQDFFNGLGDKGDQTKSTEYGKSKQDDSGRGSSSGTYQSTSSNNSSGAYVTNTPLKTGLLSTNDDKSIQRKADIQKRDLPPIPVDSPRDSDPATPHRSINISNDSLYEHLPPAPHPPHPRRSSESTVLDCKYNDNAVDAGRDEEDDGYMLPKQVQQESRYVKRSNAQLRHKSPGRSKDSLKNTRARKSRSEIPDEFLQKSSGNNSSSSCTADTDDLFHFTHSSKDFEEGHPVGAVVGPANVGTSQLYNTTKVPEWRSKITGHVNCEHSFMDKLNLETNGAQHVSRHRSRVTKNMNINPNATLRPHNLRKIRQNVKEIFPFNETIQAGRCAQSTVYNLQDNGYRRVSCDQQNMYMPTNSRPQMFNSRSMDTTQITSLYQREQLQQNFAGPSYGAHYVESEPCFRQSNRTYSVDGLSDAFYKHGDDSAISVCSRGEQGYPNESDDCYNVYLDLAKIPDDGWTPPDQIGELSVHEVSKSLQYIGMKDRVVLRFSKEQIDGSMLCTLDEKLLKEGFPELNALEIKKIMDFIRGWRPKKS